MEILTIGHSSRTLAELVELLAGPGVREVVDVRRFPGSRKFPQYNRPALESGLRAAGIRYTWLEALGGRLAGRSDPATSPNAGLRNDGLRLYADYMLTAPFREAIGRLEGIARARRTALLCAEKDPARCHRRLIADHVVATGGIVMHILGPGEMRAHEPGPGARAVEGGVVYPAPRHEPEGDQRTLFPEDPGASPPDHEPMP